MTCFENKTKQKNNKDRMMGGGGWGPISKSVLRVFPIV